MSLGTCSYAQIYPALEGHIHFKEYLRTYAEYIHVPRYMLVCTHNPALEGQNHYYEYPRTKAEYIHAQK